MCGIAGKIALSSASETTEVDIQRMLLELKHRGPDEMGVYTNAEVGLGATRLSIVDPNGGHQPMSNPDKTLWIVFNGEVYNFPELRKELEGIGCRFQTSCDTEVFLRLFEFHGPRCLSMINGPFAVAIWDCRTHSLFLARDRLGIRPLFYAEVPEALLFASEIKALLTEPTLSPRLDLTALDQIFTFWAVIPPRTPLIGVSELPPGHYMVLNDGKVRIQRYWEITFPELTNGGCGMRTADDYADEFLSLLTDAVKIRLTSTVPLGVYISGGLDSSSVGVLASPFVPERLTTFSVTFADAAFDESPYQQTTAAFLNSRHHSYHVKSEDMSRVLPDVIWHAETPMMRTAPIPMFLLSRLARRHRCKVILSGEGADELLLGYDIFKELLVRRFWARNPASTMRPRLLARLYPDVTGLSGVPDSFLRAFFGQHLHDTESKYCSHAIRWNNNRRSRRFFSRAVRNELDQTQEHFTSHIHWPENSDKWNAVQRCQYLEMNIFLSQHLLSTQCDRMMMANSVEGRFPFLDPRIIQYCANIPNTVKMVGLNEKYLLKRAVRTLLPKSITQRVKRPYRAPLGSWIKNGSDNVCLNKVLSRSWIERAGLFDPEMVQRLIEKVRSAAVGESDSMGLMGIASSQIFYYQFIEKNPNILQSSQGI